ncbi:MAG: hypothetical protein ACOVMP_06755, partial [Chthoniobacterales bacterium]
SDHGHTFSPDFMKLRQLPHFIVAASALAITSGCVNSEGRLRPPDPLGRMLFDALDPGPRNARADERYVQEYQPEDENDVWIDGAWERDSNGERVWVPGYWASDARR